MLLDACADPELPGPTVVLATGAKVVELDRTDPARPVAVAEDGRRFAGDVLVGADGIRSAVRDLAGFEDSLVFSGEMAYRALIPGDLIAADPATRFLVDRYHSTIWYGPDKHLVHYIIRGGRVPQRRRDRAVHRHHRARLERPGHRRAARRRLLRLGRPRPGDALEGQARGRLGVGDVPAAP